MPALEFEQIYEVSYLTAGAERWSADDLRAGREQVLQRALDKLEQVGSSVQFDSSSLVALRVTVRAAEHVGDNGEITLALLEAIARDVTDRLSDIGRAISSAQEELADRSKGARVDTVYYAAGFGWSLHGENDHIFRRSPTTTVATSVEFSISASVAAAIRRPDQLTTKTRTAVVGRSVYLGRRPPAATTYAVALAEGPSLRIDGPNVEALDVARALLSTPRQSFTPQRVVDEWPPTAAPFWAAGSLTIALVALVSAPLSVSAGAVITIGALVLITVTGACGLARRSGASVWATLLGLAPAVIVSGFSVIYGLFACWGHGDVTTAGGATPHMVDVYLLSFGIASTGGFLDLGIRGVAVRTFALLEMLSIVGVAGGSLLLATRAVLTRISETIRNGQQG